MNVALFLYILKNDMVYREKKMNGCKKSAKGLLISYNDFSEIRHSWITAEIAKMNCYLIEV